MCTLSDKIPDKEHIEYMGVGQWYTCKRDISSSWFTLHQSENMGNKRQTLHLLATSLESRTIWTGTCREWHQNALFCPSKGKWDPNLWK